MCLCTGQPSDLDGPHTLAERSQEAGMRKPLPIACSIASVALAAIAATVGFLIAIAVIITQFM